MNIILCHNYYIHPGGEDQVFLDEEWLLNQNGHKVVRFERHNDSIRSMSKLDIARKTIWNSESKRDLAALIQQEQADLVHFENTFPLISPAVYVAAKQLNVPVVQTLHNFRMMCPGAALMREGRICEKCVGKTCALPAIRHRCYRNSRAATGIVVAMNAYHWMRRTWQNAVDVYIALTEHSRQKFIEAGLPRNKIVVKPNFVRPDPGPRTTEGDFAIFVGRLSAEKGIETLLRAWKKDSNQLPLLIVGDGPMRAMVRDAANDHENIQWLGHQPIETVFKKIGQSRMLIVPSLWYETFGRATIEAFASGVPVIASNHGAMKELIVEGENGLLFEPGNAVDLSRKVVQLNQDAQRRQEMGENARITYENRYTPQRNYETLMNIYDLAISGRN